MTWQDDKDLIRRGVKVFIRQFKVGGRKGKAKGKPESREATRGKIRLAIKVFIEAWKAGQLRLLFNAIITGMELRLSWDEGIGRLTGEFYAEQIKDAVEKYKTKYPENFQTKIKVDGYEKYLEATGGDK